MLYNNFNNFILFSLKLKYPLKTNFIVIFILLFLGVNGDGYSEAFASCPSLTSVELMNGLVGLGASMFQNSGLTSVIIPSTITFIGLIVMLVDKQTQSID